MRAKRPDAGFTLVEVVVAFVVAALVMVAALRLFGGAFDGSARAERLTRALIAAESTMDSIGTAIPLRDRNPARHRSARSVVAGDGRALWRSVRNHDGAIAGRRLCRRGASPLGRFGIATA